MFGRRALSTFYTFKKETRKAKQNQTEWIRFRRKAEENNNKQYFLSSGSKKQNKPNLETCLLFVFFFSLFLILFFIYRLLCVRMLMIDISNFSNPIEYATNIKRKLPSFQCNCKHLWREKNSEKKTENIVFEIWNNAECWEWKELECL